MTEQIVAPLTQDEQLAAMGRYEYGWADSDVAGTQTSLIFEHLRGASPL